MWVLNFVCILNIIISYVTFCESSRILIVAPFFVSSHRIIIQNVYSELLERGHDITMITSKLTENPPYNFKQIQVDQNTALDQENTTKSFDMYHLTSFEQLNFIWNMAQITIETILNTAAIKDFIENDTSHFDLVISEIFYQEPLYMFSYKYKAPLILIGTTTFFSHISNFMGNPSTHAMHDSYKYDNGESVIGKLINALLINYDNFGRKYYYLPKMDGIAKKYFGRFDKNLPTIDELQKNVSLVLLNTHFSFDQVIPMVPGIIDIGGIHINPTKKLPEDIQRFLDESFDGAIYFALGSQLKSCDMRNENILAFVQVFEKLKQRIIWKWENNNPPLLKNALFKKWLLQNDILAHPNVKLFIFHGGMLGTQEAIHHGVPIIGIPIFTDQHTNMAKLVNHKVAIQISYSNIDKNIILNSITEIINNTEYTNNMKLLSDRFKDRQNSPKDVAAYWIEYVIRHKGLINMKSLSTFMTFWQYYLIEIFISFSLLIIAVIFYAIKLGIKIKFNNKKIKNA